jgi:hypothetical protein
LDNDGGDGASSGGTSGVADGVAGCAVASGAAWRTDDAEPPGSAPLPEAGGAGLRAAGDVAASDVATSDAATSARLGARGDRLFEPVGSDAEPVETSADIFTFGNAVDPASCAATSIWSNAESGDESDAESAIDSGIAFDASDIKSGGGGSALHSVPMTSARICNNFPGLVAVASFSTLPALPASSSTDAVTMLSAIAATSPAGPESGGVATGR